MRIPHIGTWIVLGALVGVQAAVVASTTVRPQTIYAGDICTRCKRIILERHVAGELVPAGHGDPLKFRTIRCMLTYLQTAPDRAGDVYVADYPTGKLVRATEAVYVPVQIDARTGLPNYGVGDIDYLAFRSERDGDRIANDYGVTTMSWPAVRYYTAYLPLRGDLE